MNNNQLKIIACISMLIDHIGIMLLPGVTWLRIIGRISMPVFAFLIGQGCLHTQNRKKYFLRVFALALFCQIFYLGEEIINHSFDELYLNILFTFSLSILICYEIIDKNTWGIVISLAAAVFLSEFLGKLVGFPITFDYCIEGILLPIFALNKDLKKCLAHFIIGLILFNILRYVDMAYSWWSLLAIPFLYFYNGRRGSKKFKYWFYIFYPAHLALLYAGVVLIK